MINVRKGTAHSLAQTDTTADVTVNALTRAVTPQVVAGMLVQKNSSGALAILTTCVNGTEYGQIGFAVNNYNEGDTIESKKCGIYLLDAGSVIETDQFTGTYTIADIGKAVVADGSTAGKVKAVAWADADTSRILGSVFDAPRTIYVGQTPTTVLPIKLSAGGATVAVS